MKPLKSIPLLLLGTLVLVACKKKESTTNKLDFYVSSAPSSKFTNLTFDIESLQFILLNSDGIHYIVLDERESINIDLANPSLKYLGSLERPFESHQRSDVVNEYELRISSSEFIVSTDSTLLMLEYSPNVKLAQNQGYDTARTFLNLANGQSLDIILEIDIDGSIILDSAGSNWISPELKIIKK